jgi:hypothetical protein
MVNVEQLPHRLWSLDQAGADRMIEWIEGQPARSRLLADAFAEDPFAAVDHMFTLSSIDRHALQNTGNDRLRKKLEPVIEALRETRLRTLGFEMMVVERPSKPEAPETDDGDGEERDRRRLERVICNCQMIT